MLSFSCPPLWKQPGVLLGKDCFCSSCTCCWALMTEEASSGVHLVFSLEGGVFLTAVISCGSWLSELSATALCSDLQRNYTWDWGCYQLCWNTGVLAEIVGLKIMSEHQGTNQSQPLISFHTNHFCLIRYITSHPLSSINSRNRLGISIPDLHMEIQTHGESIIQHGTGNRIQISWNPGGCPLSQLYNPGLHEHLIETVME